MGIRLLYAAWGECMNRISAIFVSAGLATCASAVTALPATAQTQNPMQNFTPVTDEMLRHPSPNDWLMYSRTYDAFRDSPLAQIDIKNVKDLRMVWVRGLEDGVTETIPIVHDGVMYVIAPGGYLDALDATNGDLLWEYKRPFKNPGLATNERTKALAIYKDSVYFTAADGYVIALDARTGKVRWETYKTETQNTSGALVVNGNVISGGTCGKGSDSCFIEADNANTGEKVWRFYTVAHPGDPGFASWNQADNSQSMASTWGLPGTFDIARNVLYWGVANPMPDQRMQRHGGDPDGTGRKTPADLYSNCTLALDPATGKLIWYYQHLPGDDWDTDHTHERTLARVAFDPNPKYVKWINPAVPRGSVHDIAAMVAEGGTVFVIDRDNGQFLWAMPFPVRRPELHHVGHRRKNRADHAELGSGVQAAGRSSHHLLLEHAELLADRLSRGNAITFRAVHRQLPRPDHQWPRRQRRLEGDSPPRFRSERADRALAHQSFDRRADAI